MFDKVLIANRGVAAVRIARTLRAMGVVSVGLRTDAELDARYFDSFDEVIDLGAGDLSETYLNQGKIVQGARKVGAQAIHPGYGFLSENADFAEYAVQSGLNFIGPNPETIRVFGLKHEARRIASENNVRMLPGSGLLASREEALDAAAQIGYPVILKSSAGGGGIGMQACRSSEELSQAYDSVSALAAANFSTAGVFVEKFLQAPRHVEVQIFGDGQGDVLVLGDRDCSLQRRNQKLVEECPAPNISDDVRKAIHDQAARLAKSVRYASAGTIEFLYDAETAEFYFLEVNTRIQVEHGVTEMVYQIDLIEWMVRLADGDLPALETLMTIPKGAAIQARFYAEDPYADFRPTPGTISSRFPVGGRTDTWLTNIDEVPHQFDPLLANIISYGQSREEARQGLLNSLADTKVFGIATNRDFLSAALSSKEFVAERMHTSTLAKIVYAPTEIEVLSPGFQTLVQSYPGRQGYWEVGVPPSGPMDDLSFRLANRLLGNDETAAGLEITFSGPCLKFRSDAVFVVCGADVDVTLDETPVRMWEQVFAMAGQKVEIGQIPSGMRVYFCVAGGLDVEEVLGSGTTFTLGGMGGHSGRCLRALDVLRWDESSAKNVKPQLRQVAPVDVSQRHVIRVMLGPHTSPDYFLPSDIEEIFAAEWKVHHNSSRTGVRLVGPQPEWARTDGGEAGLHPSNIHDNAYSFGAIDFTGDMPVILGPDGPSLGGFVCPGVVINADRWKLGQLQPGDAVELMPVDRDQAARALEEQSLYLKSGETTDAIDSAAPLLTSPILWQKGREPGMPVMIRQAGQEWLLVEFGVPELSVSVRTAVHYFVALIRDAQIRGIVEMTPGIRSLQVRFDTSVWKGEQLASVLEPLVTEAVERRGDAIPSRRIKLPLSWDDPACNLAVERYMASVRADAPWCPDNIEFIRRINGLDSKDEVKEIVFGASYLVMGLGDVYLGAPVMTPLDPRHRLVTTKYNPARTWTAENSVGIGGAYMCIYGMEGPGGYQFVGRTTPVWRNQGFAGFGSDPWLLDHFDQIQFYEVDADTLMEMRAATRNGALVPEVEIVEFDPVDYEASLNAEAGDIERFANLRTKAFAAEMDRWRAAGLHKFVEQEAVASTNTLADDAFVVESPMAASVWKLNQEVLNGAVRGAEILLLEAMKSEISVSAPKEGTVEFLVKEGQVVEAGQPLALIH